MMTSDSGLLFWATCVLWSKGQPYAAKSIRPNSFCSFLSNRLEFNAKFYTHSHTMPIYIKILSSYN